MSSTQDVRFAEGMLDEGPRLCNKLYNASRLILLGAADVEPERGRPSRSTAGCWPGSTGRPPS